MTHSEPTLHTVVPPLPCNTYDAEQDGPCGRPATVATVTERHSTMSPSRVELIILPMCRECVVATLSVYAPDDLITISEAASLAGVTTQSIRGHIDRGNLTPWPDPTEPNPQKATRISRAEVIARWEGKS